MAKSNKKQARKANGDSPTLFGWEIAPTAPRNGRKRQHADGTPVLAVPKRQQGVALLMVLFLLVMATTITMDLQFDSRVQLQLAANSRNNLQAEYLARSAIQFTHLLLSFDTQFIRMKKKLGAYLKMAPPQMSMILNRLQIWKVVPVDCGLLKRVFGGDFGNAPPDKDKGRQSTSASGKDEGKLYSFGDFQGNCRATLKDESSKINLNRFANFNDAKVLNQHILNLLAPKKYDPLFENPRADGTRLTRQEQVSALRDWVDSDNQVAGEAGNSEDSKYGYKEKGYRTKNSYFDSIEEMRLVYGVDDIFFREFSKFFTVYGRTTININGAEPEILAMLIRTYGTPIKPFTPAVYFDPLFQQFMSAMVQYRSFLGFKDAANFVAWAKNPVMLPPEMFPGGGQTQGQQIQQANLPKFNVNFGSDAYKIKVNADTFRVRAVGQVGTVRRRIDAVIYVTGRGARIIQYWRVH
jgi:general secretion pathway protein K